MAEEDRISVVTGDVLTNTGLVYDPTVGMVRVAPSGRFPTPSGRQDRWRWFEGGGVLAESCDPTLIPSAQEVVLATQVVYGRSVLLQKGDIVTSIGYICTTAAGGTTPTGVRFGLADKTGKMLAVTASVTATGTFTLGYSTLALSAAYTVPTTDMYYLVAVKNGTYGTTEPKIACVTIKDASGAVGYNSTIPRAFAWSSQADLPAVGSLLTITGTTALMYYLAAIGTLPNS